jgi:hypothetical protein
MVPTGGGIMSRKRFSLTVVETPSGFDIEELEGDLYETDYSDLFPAGEPLETRNNVPKVVEDALGIIHQREMERNGYELSDFHGLIVVVADIYERGGKLPLAIPIGGERHVIDGYVTGAEETADLLYEIGSGRDHDGAIIIDRKTGKILGKHMWLLSFPFDFTGGYTNKRNGDGTRKSIAQQYSEWAWAGEIYTMSESDSLVRRYNGGVVERIFDSTSNYNGSLIPLPDLAQVPATCTSLNPT